MPIKECPEVDFTEMNFTVNEYSYNREMLFKADVEQLGMDEAIITLRMIDDTLCMFRVEEDQFDINAIKLFFEKYIVTKVAKTGRRQ